MADEARVRKVQERILQTVASMIGRQVKDPRLELVTITDVRVTGDLQHASIFYTVLGDDEQREKAARAFASAQGLFRSRVGKALGLRLTPTLEFIPDALPESAAALEDALAKAKAKDEAIAAASAGATYAGDAEADRRPIFLRMTAHPGEQLRRLADADHEDSRRHRVQRAAVPHLAGVGQSSHA